MCGKRVSMEARAELRPLKNPRAEMPFMRNAAPLQADAMRWIERLNFAAVLPDQICSSASSNHFVFELLKSPPRLALATVHELDCRIPRHWPADRGRGIVADRLVHIIFAIVLAAHGPFETDRFYGAGTDFRVTVSLDQLRSDRPLFSRGLFRLAMGLRLILNAGDGRERVISRVALTQNSTSGNDAISGKRNSAADAELHCLLSNTAEFCRVYAQIDGNLLFQGRSCSSWAARRNNVASSPKRAANIMPSGSPAAFHASGTDIAGWPDMLNMLVAGI